MRLMILLSVGLGFCSFCIRNQVTQHSKPAVTDTADHQSRGKRKLTADEVQAVILAVQDEIYDYGYEPRFYQLGENAGVPSHWRSRLPIYVNSAFDDEGMGQVIYKLMPHGEVFRFFDIGANGLVMLDGDPELDFPPTQPSLKTVYMDDDELCRMKHTWIRQFFVVDTSPTRDTVQDAVRRQKLRTGFSAWEFRHDGRNKE
jgi:hypothetical protein